jgi:putative endonuclease
MGLRRLIMNKRSFGAIGEQLAAEYLEKKGFVILDRNYRSGRFGEVDIVALEKDFLCFIEVKTRTSSNFGSPAEAVGHTKREKLKSLAWMYLKHKQLGERNMRFDIVEVTGKRKNDEFLPEQINLIRSAF